MDKFLNDIYGLYNALNKKKTSKTSKNIINVSILSKQYIAYYLYRIITKFMKIISNAIPSSQIRDLLQYLNIPPGHDNTINYPLVGRMTNDEELLDIIILTMIEIFKNVDKYIIALPSISNYNNKMYAFLQTKNITTILKDLQSLQSLLPGINIKINRFAHVDNKLV